MYLGAEVAAGTNVGLAVGTGVEAGLTVGIMVEVGLTVGRGSGRNSIQADKAAITIRQAAMITIFRSRVFSRC